MFSQGKKAAWEYVDCVLISDHASDCVGAVLFRDNQEETSNVAFFHADEAYQQCGTGVKLFANLDFTYLGDGTVTFKLVAEDGINYNHTLTISVDDNHVSFKAEDAFPKG